MTYWGKRGSEPVFPPSIKAQSVLPHDLPRPRDLMATGAAGLRHRALIRAGALAQQPRFGPGQRLGVPVGAKFCPGRTRTNTGRATAILSPPPDAFPA
jgi:hypothetical protein